MVRYNKTSMTFIMNKNHFDDAETVKTVPDRLGFNVAFGIIDIDTYRSAVEIEKLGKFRAD